MIKFKIDSLNRVFGDKYSQETFVKYPDILKIVQNVEKDALEQGDNFTQKNTAYTEAFRAGTLNKKSSR